MKQIVFYLLLFLHFATFYGQGNGEIIVFEHHVKPGETVKMLSKKYLVTPSDIYALNKFAVNGIHEGMVLEIPYNENAPKSAKSVEIERSSTTTTHVANSNELEAIMDVVEKQSANTTSSESTRSQIIIHEVISGETISTISRKYGIRIDQIQELNAAVLSGGLKVGQKLSVPPNEQSEINSGKIVEHTVLTGETFFHISKKYGVSVEVIKQQNAKLLARGLQAGQVIKIKTNN